jgi:DNA-directed RNA polymerase subunit beta'
MEPITGPDYPEFSPRVTLPLAAEIIARSHGEVNTPETLDWQAIKPLPGGLFCESIFGPLPERRCACGARGEMTDAGLICPRCCITLEPGQERLQRWGHVFLPETVLHPEWIHHPRSPLAEWCGL